MTDRTPGPPTAVAPISVICDLCRAAGEAGEQPFADLAGLLSFTPVLRRPYANGCTPEHQRAFIAALAATGSDASFAGCNRSFRISST
ncbi:MAG: hypothetical protein ABIW03_05530 [Sphingomicrobium sp.]